MSLIYHNNITQKLRKIYKRKKEKHIFKEYTVSATNIRTEKIFFKKTLFLKSKYYPVRNKSSN